MKPFIYTLAAALVGACDPEPPEPTEDIEFRGNPEHLYLSQFEFNGGIAEFAKVIQQCDGLEKIKVAVTWSAYLPADPSTKSERVFGMSLSAQSLGPTVECYRQTMLDMGAHP